jgi:endonuclease III
MKDSKLYSQRIGGLYRLLKQKYGRVKPPSYEDPACAVVAGIVSECLSHKRTKAALKRLFSHFVDLNDLRVSRHEEIVEILGKDTPAARQAAAAVTRALALIFDKYNTVSLQGLRKTGKKAAREAIGKIEGLSGFVLDYCMVTSLKAHAVPLTGGMVEFLRENGMVDANARIEEIENFVARQVTAANAYEFYWLTRRACERGSAGIKKKIHALAAAKTGGKPKAEARKKK